MGGSPSLRAPQPIDLVVKSRNLRACTKGRFHRLARVAHMGKQAARHGLRLSN